MRMRSLFAALLMLGTVSLPALATGETIYTGVTILDPLTKHRLPDRYVVVLGERIETIGQGRVPRRYAGAARVKMTGRFAMPGLFDTHAHITLGPVTPQVNDGAVSLMVAGSDAITRHDALMLLAAGVTTIRDPGGDTARAVAYRDAVKAGRLRGRRRRSREQSSIDPPFPCVVSSIVSTIRMMLPAMCRPKPAPGSTM